MSGVDARRWGAAAGGCLTVAGIMVALHLLGSGPLAAPDVGSVARLRAWVGDRDALTIGVVVLRLVALGVGYHLIATTSLALVGRMLRRPGLVRFAEMSTLAPLRGTIRRVAGLGLSASAMLATPLPQAAANPAGTATLAVVDPAPDSPGPAILERIEPDAAEPSGTATLRLEGTPVLPTPRSQASLRVVIDHRPSDVTTTSFDRHQVRPGDHLWSIAEARLAAHLGRTPTDQEVAPYWQTVVAANPQLVDADLLFPGDEITVPPPPGSGSAAMERHR